MTAEQVWTDCLKRVGGLDREAMRRSRAQWNGIAKPLYGLGLLEEMIVKIAGIQGSECIAVDKKTVAVFCADHGVVAEGVTQTDSRVTAIVTENIAGGTASVNRMAACAGARVIAVDVGVASDLSHPGIRVEKAGYGTANLRREPAMTREQALRALNTGMELAEELKADGCGILAVGEMGIGNTTASSALASVLLGLPAEAVTGAGAGLSPEGIGKKAQVIRDAIALHQKTAADPLGLLAALGGFDIAAMTGFLLGGAVHRIPVVLDGMIAAVAGLLAQAFCETAVDFMLASHLGKEPVCEAALNKLGLTPVIRGELALGEGTGAVMLFPLLEMAESVYRSGSTFEEIEVPAYQNYKGEQP